MIEIFIKLTNGAERIITGEAMYVQENGLTIIIKNGKESETQLPRNYIFPLHNVMESYSIDLDEALLRTCDTCMHFVQAHDGTFICEYAGQGCSSYNLWESNGGETDGNEN